MKLIADRSIQQEYRSFDVHQRSLDRFIKSGKKFFGKGKQSNIFSSDEEAQIANFVRAQSSLVLACPSNSSAW